MALTLEFLKSGTNAQGAVTGRLSLKDNGNEVLRSDVFSGGNGFNPLDDGSYKLRLDIRGDESTNQANTDGTLQPFFGIQAIGSDVVDTAGKHWDMRAEWGSIRACLNPTGGTDHGDYVHGKQRPKDWTHGCICERQQTILNYLWNLGNPLRTGITVIVTGGAQFNLETLVEKNRGVAPKKRRKKK
jgi:hypothetical protein